MHRGKIDELTEQCAQPAAQPAAQPELVTGDTFSTLESSPQGAVDSLRTGLRTPFPALCLTPTDFQIRYFPLPQTLLGVGGEGNGPPLCREVSTLLND